MKKIFYLITILSLSILNQSQCTESSFAYPAVWCSAVALEMLSLVSRNIRHTIYGNTSISNSTEKNLCNVIKDLGLEQPTDIKVSHSLWPMMAGAVYSNHETLFLSKDVAHQLQNNNSLNDQAKRDMISALLMINSHFDNKVLAAYIATPIIIWTAAHCINTLIEKHKWDKNSLLGQLAHATAKQKILLSALFVAAFSCYQRYTISLKVESLMR